MNKIFILLLLVMTIIISGCSSENSDATTNNSGQVLQPQDLGAADTETHKQTTNVYAIQMIDLSNGWMVTSTGIWKTVDGGANWRHVLSGKFDFSNYRFQPYFFLDSMHAWFAVNDAQSLEVYATHDGGETWQKTPIHNQVTAKYLEFTNSKSGWLMAFVDGLTGGKEIVEIYHTVNGGGSWEKIAATYPDEKMQNFPLGGIKTGFSFLNETNGIATGFFSNVWETDWLYKTNDGGYSWHEIHLPFHPVFKDSEIGTFRPFFFDSERGMIPVWTKLTKEAEERFHLTFFSTRNGGGNWTVSQPLAVNSSRAYDFINMQQGWVATGEEFYHTEDGGQTWKAIDSNDEGDHDLRRKGIWQIDFVSDRSGWVITDEFRLFKTVDSGLTWEAVIVEWASNSPVSSYQ